MVSLHLRVGNTVYQPTVCRKMFDALDNVDNRNNGVLPIEVYCFHTLSNRDGRHCIEALAPNIYHAMQDNEGEQGARQRNS